jgi:prevent-host-death family protein
VRRIPVSAARDRIAEVLARVQRQERVILTRHGRDVGAIVPIEDLEQLHRLEVPDAAHGALTGYRASWRRVTDAIHHRRH